MKANAFQGKVRMSKEWEHVWLAPDELKKELSPEYYAEIEDLLCVTRGL